VVAPQTGDTDEVSVLLEEQKSMFDADKSPDKTSKRLLELQ